MKETYFVVYDTRFNEPLDFDGLNGFVAQTLASARLFLSRDMAEGYAEGYNYPTEIKRLEISIEAV